MTESPNWALRAWRAFRDWRRGRPFWAGVFLIISGILILLPPFMSFRLGDMIISIRMLGGVSALLIGVLMFVCALGLWLRPQFRFAAGVVAVLLSLVALVTTNLGGFLVGSLMGIVGGSLATAWTDRPKVRRRDRRPTAPTAAPQETALLVEPRSPEEAVAQESREVEAHQPHRPADTATRPGFPALSAIGALAGLLVCGLIAVANQGPAAQAAPTPVSSASVSSASSGKAAPSSSVPASGTTPTSSLSVAPSAAPTGQAPVSATSGPSAPSTPETGSAPTTQPSPRDAVAPPQGRAWTLNSSKLLMTWLTWRGTTDVEVNGKQVTVQKFTASRLDIDNLVQTGFLPDGHTVVTTAAAGSTSTIEPAPGDTITLYTQRLQGKLLGLFDTVIDKDHNPPLMIKNVPMIIPVFFTDVTVINTDLTAGTLHIVRPRITVS
ncbi:hypothetical protein F0L68_21485 [Solihabitans fulvus]|uniref:Uncharacterized protein n=1 Tax=Solihabitans fulvus TaxID=1892852 RepID=A0A5B2X9H5_9PSEU|nr:DUF6114 domain-containing protein [Solihabitans fulvus]KAA2259502.1 hypothetical protein F0L68_21485 [Solihabitans fulvus]